MLGLEALRLGDTWNVGLARLRAMTGPAEDLQIIGFVCPAERYWEDVVNVPSLHAYISGLSKTMLCFSF